MVRINSDRSNEIKVPKSGNIVSRTIPSPPRPFARIATYLFFFFRVPLLLLLFPPTPPTHPRLVSRGIRKVRLLFLRLGQRGTAPRPKQITLMDRRPRSSVSRSRARDTVDGTPTGIEMVWGTMLRYVEWKEDHTKDHLCEGG